MENFGMAEFSEMKMELIYNFIQVIINLIRNR